MWTSMLSPIISVLFWTKGLRFIWSCFCLVGNQTWTTQHTHPYPFPVLSLSHSLGPISISVQNVRTNIIQAIPSRIDVKKVRFFILTTFWVHWYPYLNVKACKTWENPNPDLCTVHAHVNAKGSKDLELVARLRTLSRCSEYHFHEVWT